MFEDSFYADVEGSKYNFLLFSLSQRDTKRLTWITVAGPFTIPLIALFPRLQPHRLPVQLRISHALAPCYLCGHLKPRGRLTIFFNLKTSWNMLSGFQDQKWHGSGIIWPAEQAYNCHGAATKHCFLGTFERKKLKNFKKFICNSTKLHGKEMKVQ